MRRLEVSLLFVWDIYSIKAITASHKHVIVPLFCDYESFCFFMTECERLPALLGPALSPRQDCMNEQEGVSNVKGFEMTWWFWLLRHGQRRPARSRRTRVCPTSSKRCSSPFGKWCFDRFDVCLHAGTNADSCVRSVNSAALMSTKRTQRSVLQSHLCCIGAVSWQK